MEKVNENCKKNKLETSRKRSRESENHQEAHNTPTQKVAKRNRRNQKRRPTKNIADVTFEFGLLAIRPYKQPPFGCVAPTHCFYCEKNIAGKDIYMYRDKGFCDNDCRSCQIVEDEYM